MHPIRKSLTSRSARGSNRLLFTGPSSIPHMHYRAPKSILILERHHSSQGVTPHAQITNRVMRAVEVYPLSHSPRQDKCFVITNCVHGASEINPMSHVSRQAKCFIRQPPRESLTIMHRSQVIEEFHATKRQRSCETADDRLFVRNTSLNHISNAT